MWSQCVFVLACGRIDSVCLTERSRSSACTSVWRQYPNDNGPESDSENVIKGMFTNDDDILFSHGV